MELETKLRKKMIAVFFLAVCKSLSREEQTNGPLESYRDLLSVVDERIEKWHDEMQRTNQSRFENDDEYEEEKHSPSVFKATTDSETPFFNFPLEEEHATAQVRYQSQESSTLERVQSGKLISRCAATRASSKMTKFSIVPLHVPASQSESLALISGKVAGIGVNSIRETYGSTAGRARHLHPQYLLSSNNVRHSKYGLDSYAEESILSCKGGAAKSQLIEQDRQSAKHAQN